jgi:hypothetical protein
MQSDIWTRLKRLDQCCDVSISNASPAMQSWTARVTTRAASPQSFEVSGATLLEAVELLLDEAERREWPSRG